MLIEFTLHVLPAVPSRLSETDLQGHLVVSQGFILFTPYYTRFPILMGYGRNPRAAPETKETGIFPLHLNAWECTTMVVRDFQCGRIRDGSQLVDVHVTRY
jgi:hypothetical protein